jgi:hypothetical protein
MLSVTYAECHINARYAECRYAEFRYAKLSITTHSIMTQRNDTEH